MIRVAFRYGDKRLFSILACFFQRYDSAHCEVAYNWSGTLHNCVSSSFLDHGVRAKDIDMPADKWRIYEIDEPQENVLEYLEYNDDCKYDVLGLFGFIISRRIRGSRRKKFCSETGAEIIGLSDPWRYDLALLESYCAKVGRRVQ